MFGSHSQRKPTFLWQGALILLPVAVMSVIGLLAIRRDKAAVEQEARQRAGNIADQLDSGLPKRVPAHLVAYDQFSFVWDKHERELAAVPSFLPTDDSFPARLAEWQSSNPGLHPEEALPNQLSFTTNGIMIWPPDCLGAPQPPGWFVDLTPEQGQIWDALAQAEFAAAGLTGVDAKVKEFLDRRPSAEARANADFIWLRTSLAGQAGPRVLLELERSAVEYQGFRNESGIPLLSLVAAEAIRLVRQSSQPQTLLLTDQSGKGSYFNEILLWLLNEPSSLTPLLISQLESLVNSPTIETGKFAEPLQAANTLSLAQRRLCEIGETIQRRGKLRGSTTTNFWLDARSEIWFCQANPQQMINAERDSEGAAVRSTNHVTRLRIYPKAAVEHAFGRALQDIGVSIPDYFALNLQFESEPLSIFTFKGGSSSEAMGNSSSHSGLAKLLAERQVRLSDSQVTLQFWLANADLLFAQQRQRTRLFGGLILASTFAAIVGLIAAYRSFRRQLRLSELKSNFVSSVSHEFRAPVASVRLMAESLEHGKISDSQKQHEYFHFIVQECRRLSSLIENVLDFSRIEQGRKQFEFEPTDIVALAGQTVKLMEAYATERQVGLTLAMDDPGISSPLQLIADGKALQQVLINLIDNAVKHSPKGQSVTVGVGVRKAECGVRSKEGKGVGGSNLTKAAAYLVVWVEDHGEGIPAEEHERIFERFYRLGSELRRQTQGVGIGLSIVKHVVEAHGGRVEVRSEVGQGSRFTIELPLESETLKSETRNPKSE